MTSDANSSNAEPSVADDVLSRRVDDQIVLVRLGTNEIFALNESGARIWELLEDACSRAAIVASLVAEYNAPLADIESEVDGFIAMLVDQGFLST